MMISRSLTLVFLVLVSTWCVPAVSAQRFAKEAELLDPRTLSYSEDDMRQMVANIGHNAQGALWRADSTIKYVQTLRAAKNSKLEATNEIAMIRDRCSNTITEIEVVLNTMPSMGDPATRSDKKTKTDRLQEILFAARDALYGAMHDLNAISSASR
jgi:hypothetical protein